jgi:sialate O-acetylesterase
MNTSIPKTLAALCLATTSLHADVKPNPLFTDGCVLQRGQAVPVWGTARDGEKVTVALGDQTFNTTAKDGTWRVDLKPLAVGEALTLTVTGDNKVTVNNILVGDVWICSGQSNMAFRFNGTHNAKEEGPKANFPKIRMFTVDRTVSIKPLAEAKGKWVECSPETVGGFSAVGYFFARDLHQKLGIPIGMIHTSVGGTPAQAWTGIEGLGKNPELQGYYTAAQNALAKYPAALTAYQQKMDNLKASQEAWMKDVGTPYQAALKKWNEESAKAKAEGKPAPAKPAPASPQPAAPVSPEGTQNNETTLFNGMVNPLIPFAIKGAIWYQGESNAGAAKLYRTLFPAMIADWRTRWNQGNFPFLFVQIAPFNGQPPEIREAQFLTLTASENTGMAVTTDVGEAKDIHPKRKEPVGQRLALAARALAYGEKIEYSGPLYQSMSVQGSEITLSFTHGTGLTAKDGDLKGFTIAGADGKFIPAKAVIKDDKVIVSGDGISEPKAARYGWANVPDVNLYNKENLPATPFRTDVEK